MKITVNGKTKELELTTITIADLLKIENVANPDMVSVQKNGDFINKDDFNSATISNGDEVDFLFFMGGGSTTLTHR